MQQVLNKYNFCKESGYKPFDVPSYEDLPAYWIDYTLMIKTETAAAQQEAQANADKESRKLGRIQQAKLNRKI